MSSDVPTINLFDNDNSSGSFFETFNQGGDSTPSNVNHSTASPFDNHENEATSLFGKSDGHSFFDSLGGHSEPAAFANNQQPTHQVNHHQEINNSTPSYYNQQQYTPQASYQEPPAAQPASSDSLFSSSQGDSGDSLFSSSSQNDPSSLFFENLSISGILSTSFSNFFLSFFYFSFPTNSFSKLIIKDLNLFLWFLHYFILLFVYYFINFL